MTAACYGPPQQWHQLVGEVDAAGFDVHIHACGEQTARTALDSIERAIAANPPRDRRHTVAHLVYVEDPDSQRFGELGVIAQFSANWISADPDTVQNLAARYGRPRQDLFYRTQDVLKSGGRLSPTRWVRPTSSGSMPWWAQWRSASSPI